jgi:hypothetical protein
MIGHQCTDGHCGWQSQEHVDDHYLCICIPQPDLVLEWHWHWYVHSTSLLSLSLSLPKSPCVRICPRTHLLVGEHDQLDAKYSWCSVFSTLSLSTLSLSLSLHAHTHTLSLSLHSLSLSVLSFHSICPNSGGHGRWRLLQLDRTKNPATQRVERS